MMIMPMISISVNNINNIMTRKHAACKMTLVLLMMMMMLVMRT